MTPDEFITQFHSLSGTTLGERRKHLFHLLKNAQSLGSGSGDNVDISSIEPKTPLEEIFKIEALIYFRKVPELIEILKGGNPIFIEKILKVSSWFLEQLLEDINEKDLIEQLFPCISFNTKVKLINKLAVGLRDTQKADALFEAVQNKYGLYLAAKLLPCCSEDLILRCIKFVRIEITPRQLLIIVKRYPESSELIFEALSQFSDKCTISCKYKNVFKHLMKSDGLLFLKLMKSYEPRFRLGWRATDTFILLNKQDFIKNGQQFYKILHKKQITKSVREDFAEFYVQMFPSSISKFGNNVNFYVELMDNLPLSSTKLDLLLRAFQQNYGSQLWDHPSCITPKLLELMSVDEREAWMQLHSKPSDMSEVQWICLNKIDVSVPALKKKISLTSSVRERAELVGCLVETCRINNDRAALTAVCKYVTTQHRNDRNSVLLCFLRTLKDCFDLDTLNTDQWKCINEVKQLFITRNEIPYYYFEWDYAYINYLLVNKLPVKALLLGLGNRSTMGSGWYNSMKTPQLQKQALKLFYELIPELHKGDDLNRTYLEFLNAIVAWNRKHRHDQLPLFSYVEAINALKIVLTKENTNYKYIADTILKYCLNLRISESEKACWLELLLKGTHVCVDMDYLEWLIRYEPLTVEKHTAALVNPILDLWYTLIRPFFWKFCRYYTHLGIPQKIMTMCLDTIRSSDDGDTRKKNAVTALSCLMDPNDFIKLVAPYYPSDLKMDPNSEENQETYKLQQAITANLRHVVPPFCTLESVLQFSKGDYLKFIQRSLHSTSLSVPEQQLVPFFGALADRAVSVRKHAIYHTFKVLDKTEIYTMLTRSMKTEKNSSIRKVLFRATFRYFAQNPDDYIFSLVQENVKSVDINDTEAFSVLMEVSKVPLHYLPQYIVFTWEILEALPKPDKDVEEGKFRLLDAVSPAVQSCLSDEFCWTIIQKYLFKAKELTGSQLTVIKFTCKYMVYTPETNREKNIHEVFTFLKDYINSTWRNSDAKVVGRQFVSQFVKEFCSFFSDKKSSTTSILVQFTELWNSFLQPHEALEEYLLLQFSVLYVEQIAHDLSVAQVAEKLAKLCDSLLGVYGVSANEPFCNSLNDFVYRSFSDSSTELEEHKLVLIGNIIKASSSPSCLLMAISLLPKEIPTISQVKLTYNRIVDMFEQCTGSAVQLYLSCYLHNISTCHHVAVPDKNEYLKKPSRRQQFTSIEEYTNSYRIN